MKCSRLLVASATACLLVPTFLSAPTAHAAPIKKRLELQLQAALFDYVGTNTKVDGVDRSISADSSTFGLGSRLGVGVGYAFSEHAEFHVLNGFSIQTNSVDAGEDQPSSELKRKRFEFLPTLRYVAGQPESSARFFIGGGGGYIRESTDDGMIETSSSVVSITSILGLHAFLSEGVSLDPAVEVSFLQASTTTEQDGVSDVDTSGAGARVLFTLGLSGWLGGQRKPAPAPAVVTAQHEADEELGMSSSPEATEVRLNLEGMGLTVSGAPLQDGQTLLVEASHLAPAAEWRGCDIALGTGAQTVEIPTEYRAGVEGRALEERAGGNVSYHHLDRWARAASPYVKLCGKGTILPAHEQQRLLRGLERFQALALRAGTFVEEKKTAPLSGAAANPRSDADVFANMTSGILRCAPGQASVTLRFRLNGAGVLDRLEPDSSRDESTNLCLAQTIMNNQFTPTGEARVLEHTFVQPTQTASPTPEPQTR